MLDHIHYVDYWRNWLFSLFNKKTQLTMLSMLPMLMGLNMLNVKWGDYIHYRMIGLSVGALANQVLRPGGPTLN